MAVIFSGSRFTAYSYSRYSFMAWDAFACRKTAVIPISAGTGTLVPLP